MPSWPSWPQLGAATVIGLGVLSSLLSSPNLPLVILFRAALAQDQAGVMAGPLDQELRALGAATVGIGDLEAAGGVLDAMEGDHAPSGAVLDQAVWWAPQSIEVERTRAWLAACAGEGKGLGSMLVVPNGLNDRAGAEQAMGLWAERSGQPSRQHFFAALESDPLVSLLMPDGVPAPARARQAPEADRPCTGGCGFPSSAWVCLQKPTFVRQCARLATHSS